MIFFCLKLNLILFKFLMLITLVCLICDDLRFITFFFLGRLEWASLSICEVLSLYACEFLDEFRLC